MKSKPRANRVADVEAKVYDAAMEVLSENAERIKVTASNEPSQSTKLTVKIPPDDKARMDEVISALEAFARHHRILRIAPSHHEGGEGVTCQIMLGQDAGYEDYVAILAHELANNDVNYPGSSKYTKRAVAR